MVKFDPMPNFHSFLVWIWFLLYILKLRTKQTNSIFTPSKMKLRYRKEKEIKKEYKLVMNWIRNTKLTSPNKHLNLFKKNLSQLLHVVLSYLTIFRNFMYPLKSFNIIFIVQTSSNHFFFSCWPLFTLIWRLTK